MGSVVRVPARVGRVWWPRRRGARRGPVAKTRSPCIRTARPSGPVIARPSAPARPAEVVVARRRLT